MVTLQLWKLTKLKGLVGFADLGEVLFFSGQWDVKSAAAWLDLNPRVLGEDSNASPNTEEALGMKPCNREEKAERCGLSSH
ncbi:hypothetical protein MPNT_650002 [Candidatus Methylacidithermus pantelleriae]|uniref:Uncharacterized protein n=1 Tax=Candidatus Methylacidithermus pantelleriae TaxID=2744239 RepID=A0A8J2FTR5_9BACT|nr:hypothetical protein MPNT_650002 [Candidatus Methylacidithermus pantelleriae]